MLEERGKSDVQAAIVDRAREILVGVNETTDGLKSPAATWSPTRSARERICGQGVSIAARTSTAGPAQRRESAAWRDVEHSALDASRCRLCLDTGVRLLRFRQSLCR
jgi:hypothetical protein